MKHTLIATLMLLSFQAQAISACKCNCNPADASLCASSYDLDHPCNGVCQPDGSSMPMIARTACPVAEVYDAMKGKKVWITVCPDYLY